MAIQQIKTSDRCIQARGELAITVRNRAGEVVYRDTGENLIVNLAKDALAKLISDAACEGKVVTSVGVGTGTSSPVPTDTALTGAYVKPLSGYSYPSVGVVTFTFELGFEEANGLNIAEFALFCADGSMFARKTRPAIGKQSDLAFEGVWSIVF